MFFVNVVWDESYNTITRTNLNINLKNCPNDKFDFFLNQTILLLENNNDYKFYYKPIALKYVENTKINQNSKSITLDCQQKQTGGSAVESAIEAEIIEMSHFIFGIADSDKEYGIIPSTGKEYTTPNSKTCKQFEKMLGKLFEAEKINNGSKIIEDRVKTLTETFDEEEKEILKVAEASREKGVADAQ